MVGGKDNANSFFGWLCCFSSSGQYCSSYTSGGGYTESLPVIRCTVAVLWIRFQGLTSLTRATAFAIYTSSFEENCAALQRGAFVDNRWLTCRARIPNYPTGLQRMWTRYFPLPPFGHWGQCEDVSILPGRVPLGGFVFSATFWHCVWGTALCVRVFRE